jgi:hypothetical protein
MPSRRMGVTLLLPLRLTANVQEVRVLLLSILTALKDTPNREECRITKPREQPPLSI